MDDATQMIVDAARAWLAEDTDDPGTEAVSSRVVLLVKRLADALEAAQRPPVAEPDNHHNADVAGHDDYEAGYEEGFHHGRSTPAERPPVSPEMRDAIRAVVGEQLTKAGLNLDGPPYSDDGETQWPFALELRDRLTTALLARFSLPKPGGSGS